MRDSDWPDSPSTGHRTRRASRVKDARESDPSTGHPHREGVQSQTPAQTPARDTAQGGHPESDARESDPSTGHRTRKASKVKDANTVRPQQTDNSLERNVSSKEKEAISRMLCLLQIDKKWVNMAQKTSRQWDQLKGKTRQQERNPNHEHTRK